MIENNDTPLNRILNSKISDWDTINLSKIKSKWIITENGISQKKITGSRKSASGSLLVSKESFSEGQGINASVKLGSVYQTGIVFNFLDKENFHLIYLNRNSESFVGYWLVVAQVKNANFIGLCNEKYTSDIDPAVDFQIKSENDGIQFNMNGKAVFFLEDSSIIGKFGLFTQQNDDALFSNLNFINEIAPLPITLPEIETPESESILSLPEESIEEGLITKLPSDVENVNPVVDYLKINPPESKTQVEFTEVFTVPLDSFYSSLMDTINGVSIEDNNEAKGTGKRKLETLDLRPKRWYRQLRTSENLLETLNILRKSKSEQKKQAKLVLDGLIPEDSSSNGSAGLDKEAIENAENQLISITEELQSILYQVEKAQDLNALLLREVRTNGYSVGSITKDRINELGFNFEITKPISDVAISKSAQLPRNLDLSDDEVWKGIETKIRAELDEGIIKDAANELFEEELANLKSVEACKAITEKIKEIKEEIEFLRLDKDRFTEQLEELSASNKMNEGVVDLLENEKGNYINYNPTDYPMHTTTSSPNMLNESEKLHKWLETMKVSPNKYKIGNLNVFASRTTQSPVRGGSFKRQPFFMTTASLSLEINPDSNEKGFKAIVRIAYPMSPPLEYAQATYGVGTYNIKAFFDACIEVVNLRDSTYDSQIAILNKLLNKTGTDIILKKNALVDLKINSLARERQKFIDYWNDPLNTSVRNLHYDVIFPDVDPLAEFLVNVEKENEKPLKTYYFSPTENGYVNQHGQSLLSFIKSKYLSLENSVSLFPVLEDNGNFSEEVIKIVKNPKKSTSQPNLPLIKFIETYQITIGWQGYGLGELSHSVNLFPGESKELVIEKNTKISSKKEQARKDGTESKEDLSSSFEDNLQNTFSEEYKDEDRIEDKIKIENKTSGSTDSNQTSEDTESFNWKIEAKANWGWGSAGGHAAGSSNSKKTSAVNNKKAFSLAQNNEGLRASNQSTDILTKNVSNSIKKVANTTSVNNKVEFSSISSEEYQSEVKNKEIIKLENPNVGRTVNYNFFQVQNQFGTKISLTDVKIVINTGNEVVDGTGINDLRVYELEEFGKIYANSGKSPHDLVVSSTIARQVMEHYGDFLQDETSGNGAIVLNSEDTLNTECLAVLNYTSEELTNDFTSEELEVKLKHALNDLKRMSFSFNEIEVQKETTVSVNAGSYHLESQVGFIPSTEKYLEDRRNIEKDKKTAEVDHLKAQTEAGIFFNESIKE